MRSIFGLILIASVFSIAAQAQLNPQVIPSASELKSGIQSGRLIDVKSALKALHLQKSLGRPKIVLIGYWPPTNEMVREFSPFPENNPQGWRGQNWENSGYDIYAFFPEFVNGLGRGEGLFQVDYQATSSDFWQLIPALEPRAVLSFGRADADKKWEIEMVTRNLKVWYPDFLAPLLPDQSPPEVDTPADGVRFSRIPAMRIAEAIRQESPEIQPFVDDHGAGEFLCGYLGYHLSWYRSNKPRRVRFVAHTHVGSASSLPELKVALHTMLRALIRSLPRPVN